MARLCLGIDCGSTTTKGALYDGEKVVKTTLLPTAARPRERMQQIYDAMYSDQVGFVVTTGYGRDLLEQSDRNHLSRQGSGHAVPGHLRRGGYRRPRQ